MLREKFLYLKIQRLVVWPLMMLLLVPNVYSSSPVFRTINGPVEGVEQISSLGKPYYAFRGIPYAEPPITGIDQYTGEEVDRRFKVQHILLTFDTLVPLSVNLIISKGTYSTSAKLERKSKGT